MQKTYRVVGPLRVHDTPPGQEFTAVLDPGQEAFLVEVGHIEVVSADPVDAVPPVAQATAGDTGAAEQAAEGADQSPADTQAQPN